MYTYIVKGLFAHQVTAQAPNALFLDAWMPQTLTAAHPYVSPDATNITG